MTLTGLPTLSGRHVKDLLGCEAADKVGIEFLTKRHELASIIFQEIVSFFAALCGFSVVPCVQKDM